MSRQQEQGWHGASVAAIDGLDIPGIVRYLCPGFTCRIPCNLVLVTERDHVSLTMYGAPRRLGAKAKAVQERLGSLGVPVTVLSMMPLRELETCRRRGTVALWTTWNDQEPHESYLYHPP
jgi:hypothetical protein